ncbi:MAG: penicillin-binding protein 2 [Streptosporangiales bacterium]|nr:penicillin-binding protein 2 [Streptosporangiales bacterium]
MASASRSRLVVLGVLVISLLLSLGARLWYLQIISGETYAAKAASNRTREVVVPAVRGSILDDAGRPLVRNRTALVVSVDYHELSRQDDGGEAVLRRLATVLDTKYEDLRQRVRLCGPGVKRPCWQGSPYQPIPVDDRVDPQRALQIVERQEDFPGVSAQTQAVREYPEGERAAQTLGYLQPVTQEELSKREGLKKHFSGVDLVGRDGLEAMYDESLRGSSGVRRLAVDSNGKVTGLAGEVPSRPGDHLVTTMDAGVQRVTEQALNDAIKAAKKRGDPADSGAAVVLDVRTGGVVAAASYPTYNPGVWIGGISQDEYDRLLSKASDMPLISRVTQGQFPPGSTFKISSMAAAVKDGYSLGGTYPCPGSYNVGNRAFRNFEGQAHGSMNLHRALVVSCDTIFYKFAYEQWLKDGGTNPKKNPKDPMPNMAREFGFGKATGLDVPNESTGRIPDRDWKQEYWEETKDYYCKLAKKGASGARGAYVRAIAEENCKEGNRWRAGDAANFSIGQGDVLVTPLQLANAYAAVANGGKVYRPHLAKALVRPDGKVIKEFEPEVMNKIPVDSGVLRYMRKALAEVPTSGTAAGAFAGFDFKKLKVAGKTGTAEVYGKRDTAWFASYVPADKPRFAAVVMINETGTGGEASAPAVRQIWEGLYGLGKGKDKQEGVLVDGKLPSELPTIRPDGTIAAPPGAKTEKTESAGEKTDRRRGMP